MRQRLALLREILAHPSNRANRLSTLVRYFKWHIGRRLLNRAEFLMRLTPSAEVILSNHENYATLVYLCGLYDYDEMQFLLHDLRSGDVLGDFGANAGVYSVLAGSTGASVLAVEPVPQTFARLQKNLILNGVKGRAFPCGLAADRGVLRFTASYGGMNHVATTGEGETVEVDVMTGDHLAAESGLTPRILKIDVEGFELPLLRGCAGLLRKVAAVIIELNGSGKRYGHSDDDVHRLLVDAGFCCCDYLPESRELRIRNDYQRQRPNSLYVNRSMLDDVRARLCGVPQSAVTV